MDTASFRLTAFYKDWALDVKRNKSVLSCNFHSYSSKRTCLIYYFQICPLFTFCSYFICLMKEFWAPWGIEPQTFGFTLRCSTTEPTETLRWARSITKFFFLFFFFLCLTLVTRRKNIFLNSSPSLKLTISSISIHLSFRSFIDLLIYLLTS